MAKVLIQGINVDVTEALENHVKDQFDKVFDHFENWIVEDIEVKVEVNTKKSHVVTVKVPVSGDDIVIEEEGEEMYPVITSISQKVHRKLRKVKEKQSAKGGRDKRSDQSEEDTE